MLLYKTLKQGKVEAKYDVTTKNALRISADIDEEDEECEIEGVVKAIDTTGNAVTITTETHSEVTLNVTSETMTRIEDEHAATLSNIKVGQIIQAEYDKGNMN